VFKNSLDKLIIPMKKNNHNSAIWFGDKFNLKALFSNYKTSDIFIILMISGIVRIFYYSNFIDTVGPDSPSYLNFTENLLNGEVNGWRTPVYPIFLKLIRFLVTPGYFIQIVVFVQSLISFSTIIVFYRIVKSIFKKRNVIVVATLLFALSPSIVNYDKCILTESLSISFMVFYMGLVINYLRKPTIFKATFYTLLTFFAVMLRPSFLYLIPLMAVFWILRFILIKIERKICVAGLLSSLFCVFLIFGYSHLNYMQNGTNSLSAVRNLNQMDIIITNNMYKNGNDFEITESIKNNCDNSSQLFHWKTHAILYKKYSHSRITEFINNCIKNQPKIYFQKTLLRFYELGNERIATRYAERKNGFISLFNFILKLDFIIFFAIYFLLSIDILLILILFFKTKKILWYKILLWSLISAQLAVIVIGSPTDYQRLFVIVLPCVIILFFSYIDILSYSVDKKKISEYKEFYQFY
jgi:hypothetical protein